MNRRLIAVLLRLYPQWWRARYAEEFTALLEEMTAGLSSLLDVTVCALAAHLSPSMEDPVMHPVQRALPASFAAWLMAVAAGINLYASVDDNPLVGAMRSHPPFMNSWVVIEAGSLLGLAAIVAAGVPLLATIFEQSHGARRRQVLVRLLILPAAAIGLCVWLGAVLISTRGQWVPMPWAITGDWNASPSWPSLSTRWIFGTTTLVLLLAAGVGGAIGFQQTVRLAAVSSLLRCSRVRRISVAALVVSLLLMAVGTGLWGLFANLYAPAIFHARSGGLLNLSTFASWLVSFILFAAASVVGFRGARLNCAVSAL